jgi:hypothetical protein
MASGRFSGQMKKCLISGLVEARKTNPRSRKKTESDLRHRTSDFGSQTAGFLQYSLGPSLPQFSNLHFSGKSIAGSRGS